MVTTDEQVLAWMELYRATLAYTGKRWRVQILVEFDNSGFQHLEAFGDTAMAAIERIETQRLEAAEMSLV